MTGLIIVQNPFEKNQVGAKNRRNAIDFPFVAWIKFELGSHVANRGFEIRNSIGETRLIPFVMSVASKMETPNKGLRRLEYRCRRLFGV